MNSLDYNSLDYVLGRGKLNEVTTTSAVPVVATVPSSRRTARSRPQDDDDEDDRAQAPVACQQHGPRGTG
jgi:hypothetical protein